MRTLEFFSLSSINAVYVMFGCIILGISAGAIGCFAFLRKRSLLGDALSHAALPGVCGAFMLSGAKDPVVLLGGAMLSCWLGALAVELIVRHTRCKEDSALGMVLSVFFAAGILMLTHIQQSGNAAQAGLDKFLFGQAASMLDRDVWMLGIVGVLICVSILLGYKEFKLVSFDADFARSIGMPDRLINMMLATLVVLAVGVGLQAVGVVLMAAMLVTPAAAARYWTNHLPAMLLLAAFFGALSGLLGAYISYVGRGMPTGPWMVVSVSTLFLVSLIFAPRRGMLGRAWRHHRFRRKTAQENVLRTMFKFGEDKQDWSTAHSPVELLRHRQMNQRSLRGSLAALKARGLIAEMPEGRYQLTEAGLHRASRLTRLHRLWELYLTRKLDLAPDHVHDDAEEIEHILTPDLERRLIESLEGEQLDPHGRPIPVVSSQEGMVQS